MCTIWFLWCGWFLIVAINLYGMDASQSSGRYLRISQQKCREYTQEMKNRQKLLAKPKYERMVYPTNSLYPHKSENYRTRMIVGITNGKVTRATDYPHMGALGWYSLLKRDWVFQCGASLISSNFLLTAAHCTKITKRSLDEYDTIEPKIVRLGARNIKKSKEEMYHDFEIEQIMVHEKYISPYSYYDIALIKLSRQVKFTKFIQPACLGTVPSGKLASSKKFTVTGWGAVNRVIKMVDELRYGEVDLIDKKKCDLYTSTFQSRKWNKTASHQICAGKMDGSIDTCNGDSGGPLQYRLCVTPDEGTMHVVIGVTAFGSSKCATKNLPSIYTKVENFIPWIEEIVWPSETRANNYRFAFNT